MKTEGPIYNQPNPNDYAGVLNLYLRCLKSKEISLMFFANDYKSKLEYAINCLTLYCKEKDELEIAKATAVKLVEAYCTSESYSILEDSTQVFQAFMEEYFHNLKVVADVLNRTLNQGVTK